MNGYAEGVNANAAIYLDPEAYRTSGALLMGRHSAGESFLRGFLRHGAVARFRLWNVAGRPTEELEALVTELHRPDRPVDYISQRMRQNLADPGVVQLTGPFVGREAWQRRPFGEARYSICGLTHTTSSAEIQRDIAELVLGPTQPHDALICTSAAVRSAVETQMAAVGDYLAFQFGPRRKPTPQLATIPLGINTSDFSRTDAQRKSWRARLNIADDDFVALYVGRFSLMGKMNPAVMALALERAAQITERKIVWVLSGWAEDPEAEVGYHDGARALCPSVRYVVVDGRPADTRFSIWSAADAFISLSDNVQETFGLTPLEAMAAGLPSVVTDWDGYRETVRDNIDGFRIPTWAPRSGFGAELAHRYANGWLPYPYFVGAASQFTAVEIGRAAEAIAALVRHPNIGRQMGEAAQIRARSEFDWSVIIPRYQDLWADLGARRRVATPREWPADLPDNPWMMDPFRLFASYPTHHLQPASRLSPQPGMNAASALARLRTPHAAYYLTGFPTPDEVAAVVELLTRRGAMTVAELLAEMPEARRFHLERGLLWLAKFGVIAVSPALPGETG